jgi:hypothetical protein
MLTEKGISDLAWCPFLLKDTASHDKRVKQERNWNPLPYILKALDSGEQDKYSSISTKSGTIYARPYGPDFWINVDTAYHSFLLNFKEFSKRGDTVTVTRILKYDPRSDKHTLLETYLHEIIRNHILGLSPDIKVKIETYYPNYPTIETVKENLDILRKAIEWSSEVDSLVQGGTIPTPVKENCRSCFWKDCPARKIENLVKGKKKRGVFCLDE